MSDLERANTQLQYFLRKTKKLYNLIGMNKSAGDRQDLGYVKSDNNVAGSSKTTFIPTSNRTSNTANPETKWEGVLGQRTSKTHRTTKPKIHNQQSRAFEPRFIRTCHHYSALGHTRPRCSKLKNTSRGP